MGLSNFLFMRRYLLPLLFHAVTSLHPHSFQRNDISTCTIVCTRVLDKSIVDQDCPVGRNIAFIDKIYCVVTFLKSAHFIRERPKAKSHSLVCLPADLVST